jgi:hypothetical protein
MDKKFYVSLEAARLLKEKGYNEKCTFAYTDISNGSDINGRIVFNSNNYPVGIYPCPTKAEAIDWLEGKGWQFSIICADYNFYEFIVYFENEHISGYRETMLEAQDAAIITVLEKL